MSNIRGVTYLCPSGGIASSAQLIVGDVVGNGVGLGEDEAIGSLEGGDLAQGELLQELGGLVGLPEHKVLGDCDLCTAVLGGDQGLEGTEVVRIGVESLQNINLERKPVGIRHKSLNLV